MKQRSLIPEGFQGEIRKQRRQVGSDLSSDSPPLMSSSAQTDALLSDAAPNAMTRHLAAAPHGVKLHIFS